MNDRLRVCFLVAGALVLLAGGCERKADESAPASSQAVGATPVAAPAPSFKPSRETPELAARSLRAEALRVYEPEFLAPYIDPEQKWAETPGGPEVGGVPAFIGAAMIYYSRFEMLKGALRERFGDEAAERFESEGLFFHLDVIGNGVREMFVAQELRQINQIGPMAYVASLDETGEQIGYSLVFREHQGEWLWIMLDGNSPWTTSRIGTLSGLVGKPLRDRGPVLAREMERIAKGVLANEFRDVDEVMAEIRRINESQG